MTIITDPSFLILIPVLLSIVVAIVNILFEKLIPNKILAKKMIYTISSISSCVFLVVIVLFLDFYFSNSIFIPISTKNTPFSFLVLTVDSYSLFFISILTAIFSFSVWFSIFYMDKDTNLGIYFSLLFVLFAGLFSIVTASDFFTLFVAWEMMSLSSYALVSYERENKVSLEAGLKYLIMSSFGSLSFLYGFSLIYGTKGTLDFTELSSVSSSFIDSFALICIIIGFGVTGSFIFLNQWLPDAHPSAPSPVSAILSGIVVKAGIYGIFRTSLLLFPENIFSNQYNESEWSVILILIGIATIIEGTVMFIVQLQRSDMKDFKRILAYSTTIHLGYIILGLGIGGNLGVVSSIFYILNHTFTKGFLFLASGYLIIKIGSRNLDELKGIGRKDTFIGVTLSIGILSLAGLPGTGGFVAKILIILSLASTYSTLGTITILFLILLILSAALAFIAGLWLVKYLVFDESSEKQVKKVRGRNLWGMRSILLVMVSVTLILGFLPGPIISSILTL